MDHSPPLPIGTSSLTNRPVAIMPERHLFVVGKSGSGKTTLLYNLAVQHLQAGHGLTVLDPHGDLAGSLLAAVPRSRTNDVVYFSPGEHDSLVLGLNLLEPVAEQFRSLQVSGVIAIFKSIWKDSWGPRLEDILRQALFALAEQPRPVSIAAVPKLLTDDAYRKVVLASVRNQVVLQFFKTFEGWSKIFREQALSPVLNKIRSFLSPTLLPIIGQAQSAFRFRWLLDERRILLANLAKGTCGEDVSALCGSALLMKLWHAALSRADSNEADRTRHFVVMDEAQSFTAGVPFDSFLAESRKYGLSLTLASQSLAQMGTSVPTIFANAATIITFRVSGADAKEISREFAASGEGVKTLGQHWEVILPASELQNLADFRMAVRTLAAGTPTRPELATGFPPLPGAGDAERVRRASLARYGRPRAEVESSLSRFLAA